MGYSSTHLKSLHDLYNDNDLVKKTIEDYNNVKNRFKIFFKIPKIGDPLNITRQLTNNYVKYIKAMNKLSQQGVNITHSSLAHILNCHTSTISEFLNRNISFFKNFVDIQIGKNRLKNYI